MWESFVEQARGLGYARVCVTDARPFAAWAHVRAARADGFTDALRADPLELMPEARRIVALAHPYPPEDVQGLSGLRISGYYAAAHAAYGKAERLAEGLRLRGVRAMAHPKLPAKAAAQRAGIGVYGRNGLLLLPECGSRVLLHLLLIDAEWPLTPPLREAAPSGRGTCDVSETCDVCGDCDACVRACPVGALDGRGAVDIARCLRAHMLRGRLVPEALRAKMGQRLLGCEVCQQVCPRNAAAPPLARLRAPAAPAISLGALLAERPEESAPALRALAELIGTNYARKRRVQTQAALLAGNSGDPSLLDALTPLCGSDDQVLRAHARWAVARVQGAKA
jgi:epoxyqueuosine reductase